ncbi:MAG TPA: hypothetical protein VKV05_10325 [Terriglobales bacterium]|nr:hypothetical protein [Terriglobales bacterium]
MSSAFSLVLAKLDSSLQAVQLQVDCLRAGLEVNDDQLRQGLTDARHQAAILRDMIRAERPDANWVDRKALEQLLQELEIAAKARRNQQRRIKLQQLANELDAGKVKHRFDARSSALNALRMEAVQELRTEAALSEEVKDLPGPGASEWLHWACSLEDGTDSEVLAGLRRDFPALERFAGEVEESYWVAGQALHEGTERLAVPGARPV